jgi:acetyltransferase-like isoleucine patch superfamily enzyme
MRNIANRLANFVAKSQVLRRADCTIALTARVNFRGIRLKPPSVLRVGDCSMFEGSIMSDRVGSIVAIGNNTFVGGSTFVCAERIDVGNDVLISWGCTIVDHNSHAVEWAGRRDDVASWYHGKKDWTHVQIRPVKICDRVWIGFNSIVLSGVTIGENAVVGCGSVVTKDVAPFSVVGGNPARVIRLLNDAD